MILLRLLRTFLGRYRKQLLVVFALTFVQVAVLGARTSGSAVTISVPGCVTGVTDSIRTFVRSPMPLLLTSNEIVVSSQLSTNASPSPPVVTAMLRRVRLGPATGAAWTQPLIGPEHAIDDPTGTTL